MKTMKAIKNNIITFLILSFIFLTFFSSCNKSVGDSDVTLAQSMIQDKTWYLEYTQFANATKTYTGQSTYFITFLKNLSTSDSDGIKGNYDISINKNNQIMINFKVNTLSGQFSVFDYTVEFVGPNNMVLSFVQNELSQKTDFPKLDYVYELNSLFDHTVNI